MIAKPIQTETAKRLNPLEIITPILSIYVQGTDVGLDASNADAEFRCIAARSMVGR
jgi:hypothetical protein